MTFLRIFTDEGKEVLNYEHDAFYYNNDLVVNRGIKNLFFDLEVY